MSCVLADRVRGLRRIPGVVGIAGVDTELLLRGDDLKDFLAKTEGLQLLSSLLLHGETVVASLIEVKASSWRFIDHSLPIDNPCSLSCTSGRNMTGAGVPPMKVGLFYRPRPTPSTIFGAAIAADDFV